MEQAEFMEQTQKLCNLYGKNLNETQAEFWYMSLQKYETKTYQKAIEEYARKNKYMPTISDLLSQIKETKNQEMKNARQEFQNGNVQKVTCTRCNGTGLIKYTKDKLYDYLCTCICENGKREKEQYPYLLTYYDVLPHVENEIHMPKQPEPAPAITPPLDYDLTQIQF